MSDSITTGKNTGSGGGGVKNVVRNALYNFTTWLLPLGLSFVTTRALVQALGHDEYGLYSLVLSIVGYTFTFSIGRAVTKYVAEYRAAAGDESEKISDVVAATFFLNLATGIFGFVLLVLFSERLAADVFRIAADSQARAAQALRIAAGTIFLSLLSQVFAAILQGLHRFDIHSKLVNLGNIALLGGNLFLALSGCGLTELFYWNLAVTGFNCLFFFLTARRLLPEVKIFQRFRPEALKLVIGYSASIVAYQILANLLVLFERAWVTRQFGTENLTFYVVSMTVSFQLHYFIASLVLVIFPLASELQNDRERLQRLYTKATKIIVSLVVIIGLTLIVQSRLFLSLWLGENFAAAAAHLLAIHTVSMSLVAGATVSWQMTEGLGYPNFNLLLIVLSWIFTVPLVIYLSESYGATGVAVGRLIGFSVMFASIFYVEKWFFRKVLSGFWLALIGRLILAAMAAALVETFVNKYFSVAWTTFLFSCAAGSLSFAAVLWMTGFVAEDERQLIRRVLGLRAAEN